MTTGLSIDGLRFRAHGVLSDRLDLEAGAGEWLHLTGPNGAGKSTLLAILAGLTESAGGDAFFARQSMHAARTNGQVAYVTAAPRLRRGVPVRRWLGAGPGRLDPDRLDRIAAEWGVTDYWHLRPERMSNGMRTRCLLVDQLASLPTLLLLDEARSPLDQGGRDLLDGAAADVVARGGVVLEVLHGEHLAGCREVPLSWTRWS